MDIEVDKINRQVHFIQAPPFDVGNTSGINNTWLYDRAPEGHKFILIRATVSSVSEDVGYNGIVGFFDGHEYTHWNLFPGVESKEYLDRVETHNYERKGYMEFNEWECKEYTIGIRSREVESAYKVCVIIYYFLRKMSRKETLMYAMKHPIRQDAFRRALRGTTVEPEEA